MNFEQDDFDKIKWVVARNTLLTYQYFNETFKIHNDASAFQLVAVIFYKVKRTDFYSTKRTDDQQRYMVTEKELICTYHKNLTCKNFNTDQVLRWRLII